MSSTLTLAFDWIAETGLLASVLTVVVLLLQTLLRKQLSARLRYALWLPVLLSLAAPVRLENRLNLHQMFKSPPASADLSEGPTISDATAFEPIAPSVLITPEPVHPLLRSWKQLGVHVWAVGCASLILFGMASYIVTLRRYRRHHCAPDEALAGEIENLAHAMGFKESPQVWVSSEVATPAVAGVIRPILLLPTWLTERFTSTQTRLVLKHELMHLKRYDLPVNALACLLIAVHWYNPLLWLAFFRARTDREAACDAQVLAADDSTEVRRDYGHALLKIETFYHYPSAAIGFVGIFQRGAALRARLQFISASQQPTTSMKLIAITAIVALSFIGITRATPVTAFQIGQSSFRQGDSIRITSVERTEESLTVGVEYTLASADEAHLCLYITSTEKSSSKDGPRQSATIKKGSGKVVLIHPHPHQGMPHVTFYGVESRRPFGGVYFGSEQEAQQSRQMNLDYSSVKAASDTTFVVGKSLFRSSDSIVIKAVKRTASSLTVAVDYELESTDSAQVLLSSSTTTTKKVPIGPSQSAMVKKGKGSLALHFPYPVEGLPHVTYYNPATGAPIGGVYFGTAAEAEASQKFNRDYYLQDKPVRSASAQSTSKKE